jgi:hypothetical protein
MHRPQFRLRSLFILTAIVAVGCWVGPPVLREVRTNLRPSRPTQSCIHGMARIVILEEDESLLGIPPAPLQASPPTE